MIREDTVFGPIRSRRLGNSLGINLLPTKGKVCNFDCIYCECGWNRDGLEDRTLPTADTVRKELEDKLSELSASAVGLDSITFSGDGESTLHPEFSRIVDEAMSLRDIFFPSAKVSVLTNASRAHIPDVFRALKKVDNPILKIDAPTNELVARINRPAAGYDIARVIKAMERFEGDFILQTMFLKSRDFDSSSEEVLNGWMNIVRHLHPREVMVYSIDRPTPEEGLESFSALQMRTLTAPLSEEGIKVSVYGK